MTYDIPLRFLPDDPVYAGHFPGRPVTPGVLQIEAVRSQCCRLLCREVVFSSIAECKFVSPIIPSEDVYNCRIELSDADDAGLCRVSAVISSDEGVKLKLKARLMPASNQFLFK